MVMGLFPCRIMVRLIKTNRYMEKTTKYSWRVVPKRDDLDFVKKKKLF